MLRSAPCLCLLLAVSVSCSKDEPTGSTSSGSPTTETPAAAAPAAPAANPAERSIPCDTLVPAATRDKYMPGFEVSEGKGAGLAAKCFYRQPDVPGGLMVEVHCNQTYSDEDVAEQLETMRTVLKDDYKDVSPPVGRAAWTRPGGNQVVFYDAETGCKVDVTWEEGKPTLELAREIEANLR